jgi:cytochrome c oxidase subunit 2
MPFAQAPFFPEQASTHAAQVDALAYYLLAVSGFFSVLIAVLVIGFAVRYRRRSEHDRPPHIEGSMGLEVFWCVVPLLLALVMFVWGAVLFFNISRPPDDSLEIYVVGRQWMWKAQHPGGQREVHTLHVPVGRPVKLTMTSEDVIHGFFVPAFRIQSDVLPGRYTTLWFHATRPGEYDLYCTQYCGTDHALMVGKVIVMEQPAFERWLRGGADGSLADKGRKLFQKLQCVTCHSANSQAWAPVLENLYNRPVRLDDGRTVIADEDYLRESILKPNAKIVAGYRRPSIMPPFEGEVNEEELLQLIAFLRRLGPGETPPRVEEANPPARDTSPEQRKDQKK